MFHIYTEPSIRVSWFSLYRSFEFSFQTKIEFYSIIRPNSLKYCSVLRQKCYFLNLPKKEKCENPHQFLLTFDPVTWYSFVIQPDDEQARCECVRTTFKLLCVLADCVIDNVMTRKFCSNDLKEKEKKQRFSLEQFHVNTEA